MKLKNANLSSGQVDLNVYMFRNDVKFYRGRFHIGHFDRFEILHPLCVALRISVAQVCAWKHENSEEHISMISFYDQKSFIWSSKEVFLKVLQFSQENKGVGVSISQSCRPKVAGLKVRNFIKKRLQIRCFPVNTAKLLRTTLFINTSGGCFWKGL